MIEIIGLVAQVILIFSFSIFLITVSVMWPKKKMKGSIKVINRWPK